MHSLKYVCTLQCTHIDYSAPPLWLGRATGVAGLVCRDNGRSDASLVSCLLSIHTVSSLAVAVNVVVASALSTFSRHLVHDRRTILGSLPHLAVSSRNLGCWWLSATSVTVRVDQLVVRVLFFGFAGDLINHVNFLTWFRLERNSTLIHTIFAVPATVLHLDGIDNG